MSDPSTTIGTTLTGGIQDISALLPLLGTDQCESHVGSALDGGYLYAAAAPLSLFGSLGIVKVGISTLISSISIPKISISFRKFSMKFSQDRWLGARTLDNAGFESVGTVAPLIAMDGTRYKAETRLMQILDEKHIDNPENLSIEWKSREWNIKLIVFTIIAGVISGTPYIVLLLRGSRPSVVRTPWIFPLLRSVGSCLAAVCCQFLIQPRVISIMKNRIIFMVMNRILIDDLKLKHDNPELDLGRQEHFQWDVDLPAEQCLWSLEQFFSSRGSLTQPNDGPREPGAHVSIAMKTLSFSDPEDIGSKLQGLRNEHFPAPAFDRAFVLISWIILCLSLPATIAGYIGCFTLVSNSQGNGPLIWLGMEAALSIIRILVWASNPNFDEETDITVKLKLTKDPLLVTTEKYDDIGIESIDNTLPLVPQRRFLEWITPYTGPLDQFQSSENIALYFTLAASALEHKRLYMTVFDSNKRIAVTLHKEKEELMYVDAAVTCNPIASEMEAALQSAIGEDHPWRINDDILFNALESYYTSIMYALNRTHLHSRAPDSLQPDLMATLQWKWSLLQVAKHAESDHQSPDQAPESSSLTERDRSYLARGHEHHLKTKLIENWSRWIVHCMDGIRSEVEKDCHHALADPVSERAKCQFTELDTYLAWEWTRRELSLVASSIALEGVLHRRMGECIDKVASRDGIGNAPKSTAPSSSTIIYATKGTAVPAKEQGNRRLKEWMESEFVVGQRKRLEKERGQTKERMEKEMKAASERAGREGRLWKDQGIFNPQEQWEAALMFIDKQWRISVEGKHLAEICGACDLDQLVERYELLHRDRAFTVDDRMRSTFAARDMRRFKDWHSQRENERRERDATIKHIADADSNQFDDAYRYPEPNYSTVIRRFVQLCIFNPRALAKLSSATVYDLDGCRDVAWDDILKSTTRSLVNVDPSLVDSIPENDHLLYVGSDSGTEPAFVQRNRDRWWGQQTSNSSMFYFSPQAVLVSECSASNATIAHIFIFITTPSRLRLGLVHHHMRSNGVYVSIQENSKELSRIFPSEELRLKEFELDQPFNPGNHELELVVSLVTNEDGFSSYCLRDIHVEFCNDPPSHSSVDKDGSNLGTMVEQ